MTSLVFPGQGSQFVGMSKDFYSNYPIAKQTIEEIEDISKIDLKKIIFENYHRYGNTVSSSIPFLLEEYPLAVSGGKTVSILAGFGVGLTSSVIVYGNKN